MNKKRMIRRIILVLVAIRMLDILLYFPVMAGKILYCDLIKMVCYPSQVVVTIWKLGKNKFT